MKSTQAARKGATTKTTARKAKTQLTERQLAAHKAWATMRARKGFDAGEAARKAWVTIRKNRKEAAKGVKAKGTKPTTKHSIRTRKGLETVHSRKAV